MEKITLFHESLLTMYKDYVIDNKILFPGVTIAEIDLAEGTQCMNDIQRNTNKFVELNFMVFYTI